MPPRKSPSKAIKYRPVTVAEVKRWVRELGLGKASDVTADSRERWLKQILERLVSDLKKMKGKKAAGAKYVKQTTFTIDEVLGWKVGDYFLPVEHRTSTETAIDLPPGTGIATRRPEMTRQATMDDLAARAGISPRVFIPVGRAKEMVKRIRWSLKLKK